MPGAPRRFPRLFLLVGLLFAATGYAAVLAVFDMRVRSTEVAFGAPADDPHRMDVELELSSIDPIRLEATLRVTVRPGQAMRGNRASAANRDVVFSISVGDVVQDLAFGANQLMATTDLHIDLDDGSILRYPFDHYETVMRWRGFEGTAMRRGEAIPIRFSTYETSPAFDAHLREAKAASPGETAVTLNADRPVVIRWFASAVYASMVAVAVSALVIGGLMFTRRRRVEATLIGALCAMMFAVPVMRNTLPGVPPLGVAGDLLIFIWAEVAVVIGLCLGVTSWARDGVRPG
jgi:hypothetical protein